MNEEEYEKFQELFASAGWKMFIEDMQKMRDNTLIACPYQAQSNDQWQFARGQLLQMDAIIGYQSYVEQAWKDQQKGEEEDYAPTP